METIMTVEQVDRALDERDLAQIDTLLNRTQGRAWEPPAPNHPWLRKLTEAGVLRRCDMRCGFEAFKETGLEWTEAGRLVVELRAALAARDGIEAATVERAREGAALLDRRIGVDFDGECHLTEDEARDIAQAIRALTPEGDRDAVL
jgi:hypothetical protein